MKSGKPGSFVRLTALSLDLQILIALFNLATSTHALFGSTLREIIACVLSCSYFMAAYISRLLARFMAHCFSSEFYKYLQTVEEKPVTSSKASKPHCTLGTFPLFPFTFRIFLSRQTILKELEKISGVQKTCCWYHRQGFSWSDRMFVLVFVVFHSKS